MQFAAGMVFNDMNCEAGKGYGGTKNRKDRAVVMRGKSKTCDASEWQSHCGARQISN